MVFSSGLEYAPHHGFIDTSEDASNSRSHDVPCPLALARLCSALWPSKSTLSAWHSMRKLSASRKSALNISGLPVPPRSASRDVTASSRSLASSREFQRTRHVSQPRNTIPQCYRGYGQARARALCLKEEDVERIIHEYRQEQQATGQSAHSLIDIGPGTLYS
jgi:hypothetical protein